MLTDAETPLQNAPLVTGSASDPADWDDECDLLIVGFGGAGVVAALQARELGADVIAVDRFSGGGATAYSGGIIYSGGTRQLAEAGFRDTADEMFKYLEAEGSAVSSDTLRRFCEGSAQDLEWLEQNGVPYNARAYEGKTSYPPDGYGLYYSGNERSPAFEARAMAAPRGHKPETSGFAGALYFNTLRSAALKKGVKLRVHSPATRLIVDPDGSVLGAEISPLPEKLWKRHEELYAVVSPWKLLNQQRAERAISTCQALEQQITVRRRVRARMGVILSTGGFTYNLQKLQRHRADLAQNYEALLRMGSMGCDGSGIELGVAAGGATRYMDRVMLGRTISPPEIFVTAVMVNAQGLRFINEDSYLSVVGEAIAQQPGSGSAWLILDSSSFKKAIKQSAFAGKGVFLLYGAQALLNLLLGGTKRSRTLESLARKCGIDGKNLRTTIYEYNATILQGQEDSLGKSPDKMQPIGEGPYWAVNVSLHNRFAPMMAFTLGGLIVDEETGGVKRMDGTVISGLYAAGRTAVGLCSNRYMSGLSIADTVFSGRRAACAAMTEAMGNSGRGS